MDKGGQPIFIIDPRKEQTKGRDVLSMNIAAAKAVANIVKSTLGPRGMDKMLVNPLGDITITNDGATILHDMSIEHPTAKMIVEVAQSLESSAGDGTTSAVVFTGALLEKAEVFHENIFLQVRVARREGHCLFRLYRINRSLHHNRKRKQCSFCKTTGPTGIFL